jgi:riboflavin synthase
MFTGLIETTGTVVSLTNGAGAARLTIAAPSLTGRWHTGDSIAVNGVCLTALPVRDAASEDASPIHFAADLAAETIARTTLASLTAGTTVNLELPTPAGSPLGGHVVQGHVDGKGTLISLDPLHPGQGSTDWRLTVEVPGNLKSHIIPQGSITIDGISLTVARLDLSDAEHPTVEVAIIPHTYASTNLHTLAPGALLNIETDALAKYAAVQQTLAHETTWLTPAYLMANGY